MTVFPMACCMPHLFPTVTAADWGPKLSAVRTHTMLMGKLQTKHPEAKGAGRMKEGSQKITTLTMATEDTCTQGRSLGSRPGN